MKVFALAFLVMIIAACGKSGSNSKSNSDKNYEALESVKGSYTVPTSFDGSNLVLSREQSKTVSNGRITCTFGTNQGRIRYMITNGVLKLGSDNSAQYFYAEGTYHGLAGTWKGSVITDDEKTIQVTLKFSQSEMKVTFVCEG